MAKLISKRYSVALFELAEETNKIDELNDEVEFMYNAIIGDKDFLTILNHPRISGEEKFKLFQEIFKDKISDEVLGLLSVVVVKNREAELVEIFAGFLELVRVHKGIATAYVHSATPLTTEQLTAIKEKLSEKLNKQIIIQADTNPELIGGVVINVDGKIIDNSIKTNLFNIKKTLIEG